MRIAVTMPPEGEWASAPLPFGVVYDVYLDGSKVEHVFAADDDAGELWRHQIGADGKVIVDFTKNELVSERLTGRVQIIARAA